MKKTTLIAGLMALVGAGSLGCKSTPKMAWWKSDKSAESTAVAHTAPALPSDIAKTSASGSAAAAAGGEAAPFVASQVARSSATSATSSATPASYPSTDAPPFSPDTATRIASATAGASGTAAPSSSGNLGSIAAAPYNPSTPPRSTLPATTGSAPIPESRYGALASNIPSYGQSAAASTIASAAGSSSSVPGVPSFDAPAPSYSQTPQATPATASQTAGQLVNSPASRYGEPVAGAVDAAASVAAGAANTVRTAPYAVATTAQPYRPGGTGTYPSTISATASTVPMIATRPPAPTSGATTPPATTAPTSGTPGATPAAPSTPGATTPTRYW
jgi:hypothetical protein